MVSIERAAPRVAPEGEEEDLGDLLAAIAREDASACARLYERTADRLFGIVRAILRDHALAEEVLQDVFVLVWRRAERFDPDLGRPMTWLITLARNRAIDVARRRREVTLAPDEEGGDPFAAIPDPHDAAETLADRDALARCLGLLPADLRAMIVAAYCGGFSREDLARRYDRKVGTIKVQLHRGLKSLRSCLGDSG